MKLALAVVLSLAALPVTAAEPLPGYVSSELCVLSAMGLITGSHSFGDVSVADVTAELKARQEACEPSGLYMQAASIRVNNIQQLALQSAQADRDSAVAAQLQQHYADERARERNRERSRALRELGMQILNTPSAPPRPAPTTTNCYETPMGVQCRTW